VTLPEEAIMHRAATGHRAHPHQGEPVRQWGLPRSLGPAAGICSSARDVLAFARMHVDGGVTADGTRVLSQESVSGMRARFDLHLADAGGDNFVARSRDTDPWTPVSFARLADQTPYLYLGGRVTPKADCAGLGGTAPPDPRLAARGLSAG
jgi:CubicO group peptidase (beta-lactamase class C family)